MDTAEISTTLGRIRGEQQAGLKVFRGIPYAEPLQGLGRVRAPQPVAAWSDVLDALQFGPAAPQEDIPMMGAGPIGDACLSLNVWAPDGAAGMPVMVWIHGGGFATGSSAQALYDAARLALEQQVIVVSLNYRLGILGFGYWADFPELKADSNVGLRDQLLALQWVQDHIAAFGGDPARVTIFGESAGGMSVACLMASPKAHGLFQRAIVQSGSGDHVLVPDQARRVAQVFATAAQGDVTAALTGDLETLVRTQRPCFRELVERGSHKKAVPQFGMTLLPVLGDDVLPAHPEEVFKQGVAADIPLLIGTTTEEWNLFYYAPQMMGLSRRKEAQDEARILHEFERALPGRGELMLGRYRELMPGASAEDLFCAFETDRMFRLPSIRLLEARAGSNTQSWHYLFDWPCPLMKALKSCHVMEIPFVFGITSKPTGQFFTGGGEGAEQLSASVRAAWAAFARGEAPAADSLPTWPAYELAQRHTMYLAATPEVQTDPQRERRLAWEGQI